MAKITGEKKKKFIRMLVVIALLLGIGGIFLVTGIRAYLTSTDTVTNTFTVGEVVIETLEPNYPGNGSDEVTDMVPRQEVKKDPQIKNTGKNRAVAFIRVDLPIAKVITTDVEGNRLPEQNRELFDYRTTDGEYNSIHDEWILLDTTYYNGDEVVTVENTDKKDEVADKADAVDGTDEAADENTDKAADEVTDEDTGFAPDDGSEVIPEAANKVSRLYGYYQVLEEGYTTASIFDVVRLINVIEGQIDNTVQDIKITSYAIQADNIEGLTDAYTTGTFTEKDLANIWDVYFSQSGDVDPKDADVTGDQTLRNSTLNVTMVVKNTHLKLHTGNVADTMTTTDYRVAYTGSGIEPTPAFASTKPEVATVDQQGNITAVGVGETTIVMTAKNPDNGKTASASVTVTVRDMNADGADLDADTGDTAGEDTGADAGENAGAGVDAGDNADASADAGNSN